jgi:2-methylisocitrate lyase-like PEP mutase family enzyme
MSSTDSIATTFKELHQSGNPVLLANVWDTLSTRAIASLPSCKALGTSSFAVARANGTEDNDLTLDTNLAAVKAIAAIAKEYEKPLTVDIQDGYGSQLEDAVARLISLNVAGANLEDFDNTNRTMYSQAEAVARIKRFMGIAKELGVPEFVLNARCDVLIHGGKLVCGINAKETSAYLVEQF